jgi:hypothetical protein
LPVRGPTGSGTSIQGDGGQNCGHRFRSQFTHFFFFLRNTSEPTALAADNEMSGILNQGPTLARAAQIQASDIKITYGNTSGLSATW